MNEARKAVEDLEIRLDDTANVGALNLDNDLLSAVERCAMNLGYTSGRKRLLMKLAEQLFDWATQLVGKLLTHNLDRVWSRLILERTKTLCDLSAEDIWSRCHQLAEFNEGGAELFARGS